MLNLSMLMGAVRLGRGWRFLSSLPALFFSKGFLRPDCLSSNEPSQDVFL